MSTSSRPDIVTIDGVEHPLNAEPLAPVLAALDLAPVTDTIWSDCGRGYVARWALRDGRLFLLSVNSPGDEGGRMDFMNDGRAVRASRAATSADKFINGPDASVLPLASLEVAGAWLTLVATSNSPTCGQSNSPRQHGEDDGFSGPRPTLDAQRQGLLVTASSIGLGGQAKRVRP